ncbi:MAG: site-2 protease family protein, partial [Acidimicrobiia bacterium]|nr:site-2 protease family protein [Acidimicrobiia bacterium]
MPRSPSPSHQPGHRIGTVAGIPVHASWTLGLVAALISFSVATSLLPSTVSGLGSGVRTVLGLTAAALFIGSILVHELAHALVARRGGLPVDGITLWLFGGAAFLPEQPRRPGHALAIALAGPLASLALGAGAFGLVVAGRSLDAPSSLLVTLGWVGLMNVALAVFNMLPGLPLDGG